MKITENWSITKHSVSSKGGIVTSHHYEASQIGIDVLKSGGNAIDAAVSMSLALGVIEPWMSGLGGCGYMLYYDSKTHQTHAIEFGVKSPKKLDLSKFEENMFYLLDKYDKVMKKEFSKIMEDA